MRENNISALAEQFKQECKLINMNYEYPGYTGKEKWAIISYLTEEDIMQRYAEIIKPYFPFLLLPNSFDDVRGDFVRNEKKHQMRAIRSIHIFGVDEEFEEHHPEIAIHSCEDEYVQQVEIEKLQQAIQQLKPIQKERIVKFFFENKSMRQIAEEEGINHSAVSKSLTSAIKNLKKFLV